MLLFFEGLALILLIKDVAQESPKQGFPVSVLVALLCAGIPYGYVAGLLLGIALNYAIQKNWTSLEQ
ncbi:MAG: hypothetical protein K6T17_07365 [Fimbriimonadales bacterium]|nr:hypothetical protein [Fimbriimonadales bacterium]